MLKKRIKLSSILSLVGVILVIVPLVCVMTSTLTQKSRAEKATRIASDLRALMPEVQNGFPDGRSNTAMPTAELDGVDFAGIIDIPAYGTSLPIRADWRPSRVTSYPCRLSGNMYSLDLIIGGSDNEGQFDFMKLITGGDRVFVTDMTGTRFSYTVTEIIRTNEVSPESLATEDSDLVFFAKNTYSFGYTVVRCKGE